MFKLILRRGRQQLKKFKKAIVESRLFVLILVFILLFSILVGRLFYLQIVKGEYYMDNYKLRIRKTRTIAGTRGNIYDRNGNLLAYNELAYAVTIEDDITGKDRNERLNAILAKVIDIVESHGDSVINSFGIVLDSSGEYEFAQTNRTLRLRFIADVYGEIYVDDLTEKQKNASAEELITYLCTDENYGYEIDIENLDKEYVLKMVNLRYAISLNSYQKFIPTVLASDVSDETAAAIMENLDVLIGVDIAEESLRRYAPGNYYANVIGYTGKISQEEYDALDEDLKEKYTLSDVVGKAGIEQTMDALLQGEKGSTTFYVDSLGKVIDTVSYKEQGIGNDVYLTLDMELQETTYHLLEEEIAGILLSKLRNVMNYDPSIETNASNIIIPADDAYHAFINNSIIDHEHFSSEFAGETEREVYQVFQQRKQEVLSAISGELSGGIAYKDLPQDMKAYQDYISIDLLQEKTGLLMSEVIDTADETYLAWAKEETISLNQFLNYAISKNWIDTSQLTGYVSSERYSDAAQIYQGIVKYLEEYLSEDPDFDKILYKYLIKSGGVSGNQICAIVYEQGVLPMDEGSYHGLRNRGLDAFDWLCGKIQSLEITPGQLALEPCTGSAVVSDPNTGEVLACVSYPGYDNNRLANNMDVTYYNQLATGLSRPFYNNATQERTAPGSTFKMVSSVAGLCENIVDSETIISCTGEFDKVTPSPRCWIYPSSHGWLNIVGAIAHSCNIFYYEIGYELGMDENKEYDSDKGVETLKKYATGFGLDQKSGLEIPESEPQISNQFSVQSAIGQGTNNYTVSQLNRYVAAVANKGTVYKLTLLDKTTDANGKRIKQYEPEVVSTMDYVSDETWNLIHQGMQLMVQGSSSFTGLEISMAGKTGTAQQSDVHADHALFVGFAPVEEPEIAVAVRIANGYFSNYPADIAGDIVKAYFNLVPKEELVTGHAKEVQTFTVRGD